MAIRSNLCELTMSLKESSKQSSNGVSPYHKAINSILMVQLANNWWSERVDGELKLTIFSVQIVQQLNARSSLAGHGNNRRFRSAIRHFWVGLEHEKPGKIYSKSHKVLWCFLSHSGVSVGDWTNTLIQRDFWYFHKYSSFVVVVGGGEIAFCCCFNRKFELTLRSAVKGMKMFEKLSSCRKVKCWKLKLSHENVGSNPSIYIKKMLCSRCSLFIFFLLNF